MSQAACGLLRLRLHRQLRPPIPSHPIPSLPPPPCSLGLSQADIVRLLALDPSILNYSLDRLDATLAALRAGLPMSPALLSKLLASSGALKLSPTGVADKLAAWAALGFSPGQLARMLHLFPRLLLYPVDAPKYQAKLRFLEEYIGVSAQQGLPTFPQYVSYSLDRIATRAAAVRHLRPALAPLPLSYLASSAAGFARRCGLTMEELTEAAAAWRGSEEGRWWLGPSSTCSGGGGLGSRLRSSATGAGAAEVAEGWQDPLKGP